LERPGEEAPTGAELRRADTHPRAVSDLVFAIEQVDHVEACRQRPVAVEPAPDRLLEAIDDALSAPDPSGPLRVVAPSVMWKYSDPDLESLSGGQKILLRMGRSNSRAVRKWLTEFRAAIG
jgi:Protein of unknown function (DUF3014)